MAHRHEGPARFSQQKPPKVYRPIQNAGNILPVRQLMSQLVKEDLVHKKLDFYKLDTLLIRETRYVAYLGQAAIDKYAEALQLLAPETWDQPITVPVLDLATDVRGSTGGRRVVLKIEHPDELVAERQRALAITKRMTGIDIVPLTDRLDITVGKLSPVYDNAGLASRLEKVVPKEVTLLPTVIQTA